MDSKSSEDKKIDNYKNRSYIKQRNKLNMIDKLVIIGIFLFLILSIVAFVLDKFIAGIISIIALLILILALLIKQVTTKKIFSIIMMIIVLILIIPYYYFLVGNGENYNRYEWNGILLSKIIEKPKSPYGVIISNSNNYLSLDVNKTTKLEYDNYIKISQGKGFIFDVQKADNLFEANNKYGYKLSINYDENIAKMNIKVEASILQWPESNLTKLIPYPKSMVGRIEENSESTFIAYINNITKELYSNYVSSCINKGFNIDLGSSDIKYTAKNNESYKISIEYLDENIMKITVLEAEYDVNISVESIENIMFSKYDVKVYIDDSYKDIVSYGKKVNYKVTLDKGVHKIRFVNANDDSIVREELLDIFQNIDVEYKIYCKSDGIEIDKTSPAINSIKIISPISGEYKKGQEIKVRVQFNEIIKGVAPTLKLKIGNSIVNATVTNPNGSCDYIDYSYIINNEFGKVEIESYNGGSLTDIVGNVAEIIKLENTGNQIVIKEPEKNRALLTTKKFITSGGKIIEYWIYVPDISIIGTYKNIPLVISLHMSGIGSPNISSYSIIQYIRNKEIQPKAIIIAPVCYNGNGQINEHDTTSIKELVNDISKNYDINQKKISIAGHSQGARHALRIAKANPNYFSACVLFSWIESGREGQRHDMQTKPMPTCQTKFVYEDRKGANYNKNIAINLSKTYKNISVETIPNTDHITVIIAYKTTDILKWMIDQTR